MEKEKKKLNLKIIIPVIIVIVAVIAALFISTSKISKTKLLKNAKTLTFENMTTEIKNNETRAKEKYSGNIYLITGYIQEFDGNSIILYDPSEYYDTYRIKIKAALPKNDIDSLEKGQKVEIIGKINNLKFGEENSTTAGTTFTYKTCTANMKNAYLNKDIFEYKGIVDIPDYKYYLRSTTGKISLETRKPSEWYCVIDECDITDYGEKKNFTTNENKESVVAGVSIKDNDVVIIKGKIIYSPSRTINGIETSYKIKDIQTITVNK